MNAEATGSHLPNLLTVRQFSKKHSAWTESSLRWLLFNATANGLREIGAIIKLGRRVLINEEKFFGWVQSRQQAG